MYNLRKKMGTGVRVWRKGGLHNFAALVRLKAEMWWRRDDRLGLGRLMGAPNRLVRLDGCKFDTGGDEHLRELLLSGAHEQPERLALARFLDGGLPAVEFGACIGVVSCLTNLRLSDAERHVVVEANPDLLAVLEANRERNRCRFKVLHRAVAYGGGEVTFHIAENVLGSSVQVPAARAVRVPAVTLRSILDEHGFERCTLICDIEGGEIDLVENEADVMRERVMVFIVEVHEHLLGTEVTGRMLSALERIGFAQVFRQEETYVFQNRRRVAA
jgi:FkbM family methyltransferase